MLDIIHEKSPSYFLKNGFLKSVLIYLVYSLKETRVVSIEFMLKIFFNLKDFLPSKDNRINDEITKFENDIIQTIKKLIKKFIIDFEVDLKISEVKEKYEDIMNYLNDLNLNFEKGKLPLYLKGFIKYYELNSLNSKKFVIIKMYNYFKKINPSADDIENMDFCLFQGYSLYEILSDNKIQNIPIIDFNEFRNIKQNRIKNIDAKEILELSIKLLEKENKKEFITELNKINNFNLEFETPKILDIFSDNEKYYEDLLKQLRFFLTQYKMDNQHKECKISNSSNSRIFWLNFNKVLLLNLSENDTKQIILKLYFIS